MAEIGQVIHRRYLLQRLIKQGQACAVYQGFDQVLQRAVTIKVASVEHVGEYRAAIRATAQFSHPNIIGIYDLIIETETLSIVQEYVDGDDFATLLQTQLSPYQVADLGVQICQSLIYAGSPTRKICHGDLTPSSIIRDRRGLIRINNFALPTDLYYFAGWSLVGGDGLAVSDRELPWGQLTEGRRTDDIRAIGLLLYQLLAGRSSGATVVDPPTDGRLRFQRNIPPELCEVVARTVVRQHPKHINTVETLITELKSLAENFEPPPLPIAVTASGSQQTDDIASFRQFSPAGTGRLVSARPTRDTGWDSLLFDQSRVHRRNLCVSQIRPWLIYRP